MAWGNRKCILLTILKQNLFISSWKLEQMMVSIYSSRWRLGWYWNSRSPLQDMNIKRDEVKPSKCSSLFTRALNAISDTASFPSFVIGGNNEIYGRAWSRIFPSIETALVASDPGCNTEDVRHFDVFGCEGNSHQTTKLTHRKAILEHSSKPSNHLFLQKAQQSSHLSKWSSALLYIKWAFFFPGQINRRSSTPDILPDN